MNVDLDYLIEKINDLLNRGETVKMKNKDKFRITLLDTKVKSI